MVDGANQTRTVKSDETLFSIAEQLRESNGAGVTELADELGLAKSSVHNHLRTMEKYRFVVKRDGRYYIGLEFLNYGEYARNRYDVYHAAKPKVDELADRTSEMSWLVVAENGLGMYLHGAEGNTDISVSSLVGSWTHLHYNSGGKAILAHLSREDVERILDRHGLPKRTPNTITDREALFEELELIRERGYSMNLGEDLEGIRAIAVPLIFQGRVYGALTLAGAAHRLTMDRCENELSQLLLAAADDVEVSMAYQ